MGAAVTRPPATPPHGPQPPQPMGATPPRLPVGEPTTRGLGPLWRRVARPDQAVTRRVFNIAWPVALTNLLQTVALTVDLAFVGALGAGALAATGVATQAVFLAMALGTGVAAGATAVVARAFGAGDIDDASRATSATAALSILLGIPLLLVPFLWADPLVRLLGADDALASDAALVLRILALGLPGQLLVNSLGGALAGAGDTRPALVVGLIVNALNVALDAVLIFGWGPFPAMGLSGAAIATSISFLVGGLLILGVLASGRRPLRLASLGGGVLATHGRRLLRVGLPASAESLLLSIGFAAFLVLILRFGTEAVAAHQIGLRIQSFAFMPGFGFAAAASALVGQGLGRGSPHDAERDGWTAIGMGFLVMVGVSLPMLLVAEPVTRLFTSDPIALSLGVDWIGIIVLAMPAIALHFTAAGALRGAGDTRWPLAVSFIGLWLVRLPLSWFFAIPMGWGMHGVWVGYVVEYYGRALVMTVRYARGSWKTSAV